MHALWDALERAGEREGEDERHPAARPVLASARRGGQRDTTR
jgi:hypothetical protein